MTINFGMDVTTTIAVYFYFNSSNYFSFGLFVVIVIEFQKLLRLGFKHETVSIINDHQQKIFLAGERETHMRDKVTFLQRGNLFWELNLLGFHPVETVPEANDVIHRTSHKLILLIDV